MANKQRGERTVTLDKPRLFKLDFNAICDAEGVIGRPVVRADLGFSEIRAILWAGLKHEDKRLTVEKVGDFLGDQEMLSTAMGVVAEAINEFFNVDSEKGEAEGAGATPTG